MAALISSMNSHLRLFAATSHPELAALVAKNLGIPVSPLTVKRFACGELYVRFEETVRGKDVYLVGTCRSGSVNEDMMELFLLCDAARQSFAKSIHVVMPFFGYSR